ncbi:MAG: PadR family transcriptional regulator [Thaumarchaeota archaeon]|nr:PadR family transcriptional regulator [Nitrososphaerota archaeon]
MAFAHLRESMTRGNLWLYILSELRHGKATPGELRSRVGGKHGFTPAAITFYTVLYRLRKEGLVRKSSDVFRSAYEITPWGSEELERGLKLLEDTRKAL